MTPRRRLAQRQANLEGIEQGHAATSRAGAVESGEIRRARLDDLRTVEQRHEGEQHRQRKPRALRELGEDRRVAA